MFSLAAQTPRAWADEIPALPSESVTEPQPESAAGESEEELSSQDPQPETPVEET